MALIGVNAARVRPQKRSTLDQIAEGVQLAQSVLGLGLAVPEFLQKRGALKAEEGRAAAEEARKQGQFALGVEEKTRKAEPVAQPEVRTISGGGLVSAISPTFEKGSFEVPGFGQRVFRQDDSLESKKKKFLAERVIREESEPSQDELEQFEKAYPSAPVRPKTRKELFDMTKALDSQRIREDRSIELGKESRERIKISGESLTLREDMKNDREVERLSKTFQVSGIGTLQDKMDQVFEIIDAPRNKGDIPGFGRGESLIPTKLTSGDANKLRRLISSFRNITLKVRSGAAVTAPEMARFLEEFGSGRFESEESLLIGLNQLRRSLDVDRAQIFAGFKPAIVDLFNERARGLLPGIGAPGEVDAEDF